MPSNLRPVIVIGLAVVTALTACARGVGDSGQESPLPSRQAPIPLRSTGDLPSDGDPTTGEIPNDILSAILADAARRTDVSEDEITVIRGVAVTWNDGSLGCPEPGMLYTQALVDGYHVVLDADGETVDYRVGPGAEVRLCESPIEGGS